MASREIRTGVGTYQRPDGQWTHGVLGDEVDVNEADLDRFDRLNGTVFDAIESADPAGEPVELIGEPLPDASWSHDRIDGFATDNGISYDGIDAKNVDRPTREEKVAHILATLPEATLIPAEGDLG